MISYRSITPDETDFDQKRLGLDKQWDSIWRGKEKKKRQHM